MPQPLQQISPLDGRYFQLLKELGPIFSEQALMRYRLLIEVEYLIALAAEPKFEQLKPFSDQQIKQLQKLYQKFSDKDAESIKKIEKTVINDVKSIEYFLKGKISNIGLGSVTEFIHFALTSEDINNLSYSSMLIDGLIIYRKQLEKLLAQIKKMALAYRRLPLLALTHGQTASPTTLGKELAVFYVRIKQQAQALDNIKLTGKFSGATGTWGAQQVAAKQVDWLNFSQKFVESLGLIWSPITTQIEPHDQLAATFHGLARINTIIQDLDRDCWLYISRGIFKQKSRPGEVGSSTMPHKVNPIDFENSEGNVDLANSVLLSLASNLPTSRLQRDLSDSTKLRNQGVGLGYSLLATKMALRGLQKLEVNKNVAKQELIDHPEVLAEAIQVVLRKVGFPKPYETLKKLTYGKTKSLVEMRQFIQKLDLPKKEKAQLLKLTPENYIGLAAKIVEKYIK